VNKLISIIILSLSFAVPQTSFAKNKDNEQYEISATGVGIVDEKPTSVNIVLGANVNADSVNEASNMLAQRSTRVIKYLQKQEGITGVNTGNMRIYTNYRHVESKDVKEYSAQMTVSFDSSIPEAPKHIDECLLLGANRVDGYNFKLSDEAMAKVDLEAIELATQNAISQINASLRSVDLKLTGIKKIEIIAKRAPAFGARVMLKSASAQTPIESDSLSVSREVRVTAIY